MTLSNDIYIHFPLENEIGKIAILKTHAETLCSILKKDPAMQSRIPLVKVF